MHKSHTEGRVSLQNENSVIYLCSSKFPLPVSLVGKETGSLLSAFLPLLITALLDPICVTRKLVIRALIIVQ